MKDTIKGILVLAVVAILSGLTLSTIYNYAIPGIVENRKEAIEVSIFNIMPSVERYVLKEIGTEDVYFCYDKRNHLIGYTFEADGVGYQGQIIVMVGLDRDLNRLTGIEVLKHSETPGLGAKIITEKFRKQFKGLKIHPVIEYTKGTLDKDNQIQAITGATVTSKSIVNILSSRIKKVIQSLENYNE